MNEPRNIPNEAVGYLNRLLNHAFDAGADAIEFERVPEGLEVSLLKAGSGIGTVIEDPELESGLIELIVARAALKKRPRGKLTWTVHGKDRVIAVEEYDSFGESSFRMKLGG
jgi:hypothetical protein